LALAIGVGFGGLVGLVCAGPTLLVVVTDESVAATGALLAVGVDSRK
jgi:hypothetical protein